MRPASTHAPQMLTPPTPTPTPTPTPPSPLSCRGHDNHHDHNVYAYVSQTPMCNGYDGSMAQMLDGHVDSFFNNTVVMLNDGAYAKPICSGEGASLLGGNTIFSPSGNITECGMSVQAWQAAGHDAGTVVMGRLPTDQELLDAGKRALGLQ